jgi:hypothetical protein
VWPIETKLKPLLEMDFGPDDLKLPMLGIAANPRLV